MAPPGRPTPSGSAATASPTRRVGTRSRTGCTTWAGGVDHNTAGFALASIRRWWDLLGSGAYPHAKRLLITCDAGGANGWRNRAWKTGLARLVQDTGLQVMVCHFPPGTSKWNRIEHRLFSQITPAWRGRPLTSHDVIINTIGAVTTATACPTATSPPCLAPTTAPSAPPSRSSPAC